MQGSMAALARHAGGPPAKDYGPPAVYQQVSSDTAAGPVGEWV
jgi:hypothetical protein